tara:strand:+ start:461 stop:1066 length:606 start_codon:yes stop_codon:yes gene_type:complete
MAIMKHVGKYGEKPCVVVFREIPNEPENCLVVMSDSLDEVKHDNLMNVVQSAEGQEAKEFSEVLNRRQFSSGENMLQQLHAEGKLAKVPVSMVSLTPTPNDSIALAEVNAEIKKLENDPVPPVTDPAHLADDPAESNVSAPSVADSNVDSPAQGLLLQAELMEQDAEAMLAEAKEKKRQAFEMDPSLKPKRGPGRPPKEDI